MVSVHVAPQARRSDEQTRAFVEVGRIRDVSGTGVVGDRFSVGTRVCSGSGVSTIIDDVSVGATAT